MWIIEEILCLLTAARNELANSCSVRGKNTVMKGKNDGDRKNWRNRAFVAMGA
jgi:hypothetical protein